MEAIMIPHLTGQTSSPVLRRRDCRKPRDQHGDYSSNLTSVGNWLTFSHYTKVQHFSLHWPWRLVCHWHCGEPALP